MKVSDNAIARLRAAVESPDLEGSRYHLLDKLGQGGMGGVYRVEDSILGRQVAMKVVAVPDSTSSLADRLLREAQIIARLEHPGIVPVHDVGTLPDGRVFYTMKLVQGKRLDAHAAELGTIPERLRLVQKICDAVSFAHARGVLHRDLKPQNVMVGPFGEVLVMDWGLSKIIREQEATRPSDSSRYPVFRFYPRGHLARLGSWNPRLHGARTRAWRQHCHRRTLRRFLFGCHPSISRQRPRSRCQPCRPAPCFNSNHQESYGRAAIQPLPTGRRLVVRPVGVSGWSPGSGISGGCFRRHLALGCA